LSLSRLQVQVLPASKFARHDHCSIRDDQLMAITQNVAMKKIKKILTH